MQAQPTSNISGVQETAPGESLARAILDQAPLSFHAAAELVRRGAPLPDELLTGLNSEADGVVRTICWVLCQSPDPRATRLLAARLERGPAPVRDAVAQALLRLATRESIETLARALSDERKAIRLPALHAAGWRQADFLPRLPRAVGRPLAAPLSAILTSADDAVERVGAVQALRLWGFPEATPALIHALRDPVETVRDLAVAALAAIARGRSRWAETARAALEPLDSRDMSAEQCPPSTPNRLKRATASK